MDRGGNFIGRLSTVDGHSAAFLLVQAGLAKVHESAYGTANYKQLIDAEEKCRRDRVGVWTNYEEPNAKDNEETEEAEGNPEGQWNESRCSANDSFLHCRRTRRNRLQCDSSD